MHWVIGDVHGMLLPLRRLIDAVDRADTDRTFIFTGDYVNRGPESAGVIALLLTLPRCYCLCGNHDEIFDLILRAGAEAAPPVAALEDAIAAFRWFIKFGLDKTLESYGLDALWVVQASRRLNRMRLRDIYDAVPPAHRSFLAQLPLLVDYPNFFVAHGRWDPMLPSFDPTPLERIRQIPVLRQELLWGRFTVEEIDSPKQWGRTGYFGHTPVYEYGAFSASDPPVPVTGPNIVLVDTGCAMVPWGRLSAVCIEDGRVIQCDREGNIRQS